MPKTPMIPLGLKGLNTDVPSHALSMENFTGGNNMRAHNGALRGVNSFASETNIVFTHTTTPSGIYAAVQFTPTGSTYYNIIALAKHGSGDTWRVKAFNQNGSATTTVTNGTDVTTGTLAHSTTHKPSMFIFNECLVLNTGNGKPMYLPAQGATLRNFDSDDEVSTMAILNDPLGWIPNVNGEAIYCSKLRPFGGRLAALSLFGANGTYNERSTVVFSSPILTLGSLKSLQWTATTENSVADDIITETPGAVIDGGQLGSNFIVYKNDSVLAYTEINSEPYVVGRVIQTDDGIIASDCWADIGNNQHIVFGNRGVYIHNGENQKQNVSKNKIQDALYNDLHEAKKEQCFLFRHERDKETWICIPTDGSGEGCDKAYVYAEETDTWYTRDLDNYTSIFTTEISGVVRIFATKPTSANLQELHATNVVAGGTTEFSNNAIETSAHTKTLTAMYPTADATMQAGMISTDKLGTSATITMKSFDPSSDHKIDLRETGRYFDLKLQVPSTTDVNITGAEFEIKARGKR